MLIQYPGGMRGGGSIFAPLFLPNGTAAAPALAFTSDTDTGLYRISANVLGVTTAGVLAVTFSATGDVTAAGQVVATTSLVSDGNSGWLTSARGAVRWPADGVINLLDNAQTSFGRVNFGGATSSFPALKRSTTTLQARLGDDSAYTTVDALAFQTSGNALNYSVTAYAVGTPYVFTNTAAAIDVGTTDPAIVLDKAGTYLIFGQVHMAYNAATVAAETATIKVRRTNNTAADLSAVVVIDLPASTLLTNSYGIEQIPPFVYTTTATDDAITIFANVSAALSAGSIDATAIGTSIVAIRIS